MTTKPRSVGEIKAAIESIEDGKPEVILAVWRAEMVAFYRDRISTLYVSLGAEQGQCNSCGRPIWWVTTKNGKAAPFTQDALNHFGDCPHAAQHRKAST